MGHIWPVRKSNISGDRENAWMDFRNSSQFW